MSLGTDHNDFALARFTDAGLPAGNFGPNHDGQVVTDFGNLVAKANAIAIDTTDPLHPARQLHSPHPTKENPMAELALLIPLAAAGWAALITWGLGGGIGMFIVLFIILKVLGK